MAHPQSAHQALVISCADKPPAVETRPNPTSKPGTVVLRILSAPVVSFSKEIYPPNNVRGYPYPYPLVPGAGAIARVEEPPPDSAAQLSKGQLVLFSPDTRGREDTRAEPAAHYLLGMHQGFSKGSISLMSTGCRDGAFAQIISAPVENVFILDEAKLTSSSIIEPKSDSASGYERLSMLVRALIPFGGLRAIELQAGDTIAITPATGQYAACAVACALALGAKVVAVGRREASLAQVMAIAEAFGPRASLETVLTTGEVESDVAAIREAAGLGGLDAVFDMSPPSACAEGLTPPYLMAAMLSLRVCGRIAFMGGITGNISLPYSLLMGLSLRIQGKFMYEPEDVRMLVKMVESGLLPLNWVEVAGKFPLEKWSEAWDKAARGTSREVVLIEPQG